MLMADATGLYWGCFFTEVTLSKMKAQHLLHWRTYLGRLWYEVVHIPGEESYWGDLPFHWRRVSLEAEGDRKYFLSTRAVTVYALTPTSPYRRKTPS